MLKDRYIILVSVVLTAAVLAASNVAPRPHVDQEVADQRLPSNLVMVGDAKKHIFYQKAVDGNWYWWSMRASDDMVTDANYIWPDEPNDVNSVLFIKQNSAGEVTLDWGPFDANSIVWDGNDFGLPLKTPWSVMFVDANGYPLYEDNDDFSFYWPEHAFGIGLGNIAPGTRANNYIQVYSLLDFDPNLFNVTIGRGSDDVATGPNNVTIGRGAGNVLDEGYENTLGGTDAGQYLQDANDNTGWGYKVIGGSVNLGTRIRDEATIVTNNTKLLWYDEDYNLLESTSVGAATTTLDIADDGLVYIGTTTGVAAGCIWVFDLDRNVDKTFFTPTGGWPSGSTVLSVKVTPDQQYVWAACILQGLTQNWYCFNRETGAQECAIINTNGAYSYGMGIDEDGNAWGMGIDLDLYGWPWYHNELYGWQTDGTQLVAYNNWYMLECGSRDCKFDYTMDRVFSVGSWNNAPGWDSRQISGATISTGGDLVYYQTGTFLSGAALLDVETDGTYVYACGTREPSGVGGANATVYKFDSDLNLLASYDTGGDPATAIWLDWNGNLVVKDPGVDKFFVLDTDDLSLIASYDWTDSGPDLTYGCEGLAVPFAITADQMNVHRVTAVGAYAATNAREGADDGLYLGTYSGSRNDTDPNRFFLDNLDRSTYLGEKEHGMMYGYFADDPNDQWLNINADVNMLSLILRDSLTVPDANITNLTIAGFDAGSVLFTDVNGLVTQDNANFNFDDSNDVLDVNAVRLSGLTASRLLATDANKVTVSTDANDWISGTANRVTVADDGDGTVTLSAPQDLHSGASPTFAGLTIVNAINEFSTDVNLAGNSDSAVPTERAVKTYVDAVGDVNFPDSITGTTNQIVVTDDGDNTVTLSTPQDIGTTSDVAFGSVTLTKGSGMLVLATGDYLLLATGDKLLLSGTTPIEDAVVYVNASYRLGQDEDFKWDAPTNTLSVNGTAKFGDGGATDYSTFETDGTLVFNGDATVWDDMRIVPGSFDRPGVSDPAYVAYDVNGSGTTIYLTEWAKNDFASFTVQLPHSYDQGEDISVHIHWTPGSRGNEEAAKKVGWKVIYSWANIDGVFINPPTADLSDTCTGTDHYHEMTGAVTISGAGKGISSMLVCNIKRTDTGADDTWSSASTGELPLLLEVDFHYPIDTVGSRGASSK